MGPRVPFAPALLTLSLLITLQIYFISSLLFILFIIRVMVNKAVKKNPNPKWCTIIICIVVLVEEKKGKSIELGYTQWHAQRIRTTWSYTALATLLLLLLCFCFAICCVTSQKRLQGRLRPWWPVISSRICLLLLCQDSPMAQNATKACISSTVNERYSGCSHVTLPVARDNTSHAIFIGTHFPVWQLTLLKLRV